MRKKNSDPNDKCSVDLKDTASLAPIALGILHGAVMNGAHRGLRELALERPVHWKCQGLHLGPVHVKVISNGETGRDMSSSS